MAAAAVVLPCSCGAEGMGEGSRGRLAGGLASGSDLREWGGTSGRQARAVVDARG